MISPITQIWQFHRAAIRIMRPCICGNYVVMGDRRRLAESGLGGDRAAPYSAHRTGIVRKYEIGDAWRDLGAKPRTVEHPVMPDGRLEVVRTTVRRDVDAQFVGRFGLADARNVVV